MSGMLKTDQPHGYEQVHSAGFTFPFRNVVWTMAGHLVVEHGMPLMIDATQLRSRLLGLALSASRTG
jgi:hypothetical protein